MILKKSSPVHIGNRASPTGPFPAQLLNAAEDAEILDSGTIGLVAALFFVASGAQNHRAIGVQCENR